jgi:hypothetical protein
VREAKREKERGRPPKLSESDAAETGLERLSGDDGQEDVAEIERGEGHAEEQRSGEQ